MSSNRPLDHEGLRRAFSYPRSSEGATTVLGEILLKEIAKNGPISFRDYMGKCLYHSEHGYYARPDQKTVSKEGDFITSVSVGPVFGKLLAQRLHHFWQSNGNPADFVIYEVGAHDGSLAKDVLTEITRIGGDFEKASRYRIIEPLAAQRQKLQRIASQRLEVLAAPPATHSPHGALLANEVLDALPVPLFLHSADCWHEVIVTSEKGTLEWDTQPTEQAPGGSLSEGYVTEGAPDLTQFLQPLTQCFENGIMIFIDYGLDEESLYHPDRNIGTLRCFREQSTKSHPLELPGKQDLTADVNFTVVEKVATALGLRPCPVMDQSRYLTHSAKGWLTSQTPPTPAELRQFQTLIHPSQFGMRFYAIELLKGEVDQAFP